jgi:hypothetical protein
VARGIAQSPVRVLTPAGPLDLRIESSAAPGLGDAFLTGPAVIIGEGEFFA